MANQNKVKKLWAIYDQESRAVAISLAHTRGGAMKRWEEKTGGHRDEIFVEEIVFGDESCFSFVSLN